ncbi:hypothetical protein MACH09_22080 [Vibrio sp. MACH09]|nr:hypothetical protein MACH09_22080 [Vibrio sp. MACH09]
MIEKKASDREKNKSAVFVDVVVILVESNKSTKNGTSINRHLGDTSIVNLAENVRKPSCDRAEIVINRLKFQKS